MYVLTQERFSNGMQSSLVLGCYKTREKAKNAASTEVDGIECTLKNVFESEDLSEINYVRGENWLSYIDMKTEEETFIFYRVQCLEIPI